MKVILQKDLHIMLDGAHVRKHCSGDVIVSKNDTEKQVLRSLVDDGLAIEVFEKKAEKPKEIL